MRAAVLVLLGVAAPCAGAVRADVVDTEPPASCPRGSTPGVVHSGPYCALSPCADDALCDAGERCIDLRVCTEERGISCSGLGDDPCSVSHVLGPCDADGRCATGTCRTTRACGVSATAAPATAEPARAPVLASTELPHAAAPAESAPAAGSPDSRGGVCALGRRRTASGVVLAFVGLSSLLAVGRMIRTRSWAR